MRFPLLLLILPVVRPWKLPDAKPNPNDNGGAGGRRLHDGVCNESCNSGSRHSTTVKVPAGAEDAKRVALLEGAAPACALPCLKSPLYLSLASLASPPLARLPSPYAFACPALLRTP